MFNVGGHIDRNFTTDIITIKVKSGSYVDGIWNETLDASEQYNANVQPVNFRERRSIEQGGQRLIDGRKIYINDSAPKVFPSDRIEISGIEGEYEVIQTDIRKARRYCKLIVSKVDL